MCSHRCGRSRKCFAARSSRTKHRRSLFSRLYLHWSFGCLQLAGRISGQEFVTLSANQFTLCSGRQVEIHNSARGVAITANQFVATTTLGADIPEAILIAGGSDHLIHDNVVLRAGTQFGFAKLLENAAVDSDVAGNWSS